MAAHGCRHSQIEASDSLFQSCSQIVQKFRHVLSFILGNLITHSSKTDIIPEYLMLDRYMLHLLYNYNKEVENFYNDYQFDFACKAIRDFIVREISSFYCHLVKDRLYSDDPMSPTTIAVINVLHEMFYVLAKTVAPILPQLVEEAWSYHPDYNESELLHHKIAKYEVPKSWKQPIIVNHLEAALRLKKNIAKLTRNNTWRMSAVVELGKRDFILLSTLHRQGEPSISELCEIVQLSSIKLIQREDDNTHMHVCLMNIKDNLCQRCKRHPEAHQNGLCDRCTHVLGFDTVMIVK